MPPKQANEIKTRSDGMFKKCEWNPARRQGALSSSQKKLVAAFLFGPHAGDDVRCYNSVYRGNIPFDVIDDLAPYQAWPERVKRYIETVLGQRKLEPGLKLTTEMSASKLRMFQDAAYQQGDIANAIKCEKMIGELNGLYVSRKHQLNVNVFDQDPEHMQRRARVLVQQYPELLKQVTEGPSSAIKTIAQPAIDVQYEVVESDDEQEEEDESDDDLTE